MEANLTRTDTIVHGIDMISKTSQLFYCLSKISMVKGTRFPVVWYTPGLQFLYY